MVISIDKIFLKLTNNIQFSSKLVVLKTHVPLVETHVPGVLSVFCFVFQLGNYGLKKENKNK